MIVHPMCGYSPASDTYTKSILHAESPVARSKRYCMQEGNLHGIHICNDISISSPDQTRVYKLASVSGALFDSGHLSFHWLARPPMLWS